MKDIGENNGFVFQEIIPLELVEERVADHISAFDNHSHNHNHSHKQAEKRRRDRINAQLAKLRKLIPKSDKMDKAALLGRVVEQVRDLKGKASDISEIVGIPTDIDEVTVECQSDPCDSNDLLLKVTICCEDRPDLINELVGALKSLSLATVEAEIVCLAGRMKTILVLHNQGTGNGGKEECVRNVSEIKQSLTTILTRIVSWSTSTPSYRVSSRRQRFFFSPY